MEIANSSLTTLIAGLLLIFAIILINHARQAKPKDSRELSAAKQKVPFIGHLLGMRKHGVRYFEVVRRRTSMPAYRITIMGKKYYVMASPSLAQVALNTKTLALEPLLAQGAGTLLGVSKDAVRLLGRDPNAGHWLGSPSATERKSVFTKQLAPGPGLSSINEAAGNELSSIINSLETSGAPRDLYTWLRDTITIATTAALYGPKCPLIIDKSFIDDVWAFDAHQLGLVLNFFPRVTAKKGYYARERLAVAFEDYIKTGHYKQAHEAVRSTIDIFEKHGFSQPDLARLEIFNVSVATVNTTPTVIWMIFYIFSRPQLLKSLREEVERVTKIDLDSSNATRGSSSRHGTIDMPKTTDLCPLLHATYQEALRLVPMPTCNRRVLEDTMIKDPVTGSEFMVAKGRLVVIPTSTLHLQDALWNGEEVEMFSPERFLSTAARTRADKSRFLPYGGGGHMCPGRYFAKWEILTMVSLIMMALEIEAPDGSVLKLPKGSGGDGALKPSSAVMAKISPRIGWDDIEWTVRT